MSGKRKKALGADPLTKEREHESEIIGGKPEGGTPDETAVDWDRTESLGPKPAADNEVKKRRIVFIDDLTFDAAVKFGDKQTPPVKVSRVIRDALRLYIGLQ